uniref:MRG/MORF4L binding protein n=1 Tax=Cyprinodon variegatus TaxID=28743 RepID=A0A3Q2GCB2_CYPVA
MGEAEVTLSQAEEKPPDSALVPGEDSVVWSHEVEVCLFHAMIGHKPVGVNRHFHMICIRDKFSQNIGRQVSSSVIWDHLGTMYDMQALHESEILPFPNTEKSFSLPEEIIQEVKGGEKLPVQTAFLLHHSAVLRFLMCLQGSWAQRRRPRRRSGWTENLLLRMKKVTFSHSPFRLRLLHLRYRPPELWACLD